MQQHSSAMVNEQHLDTLAPPGRDDEFRALSVPDRRLLTPAALARWTAGLADDEYTLADVVALERQRQRSLATVRDGIELTDLEFQVVRQLQRHEGRVVTFAALIRVLWPDDARGSSDRALWERNGTFYRHTRHLHQLMSTIRRKLELDPLRPQHLVSIRGVGYRWYSRPPARDDGEDYTARADEARELRYQIRGFRGELPPPRDPQTGKFGPGPDHPDYQAIEAEVTTRRSQRRTPAP